MLDIEDGISSLSSFSRRDSEKEEAEGASVVVRFMTSVRSRHLANLTDHESFRFYVIQLILSDIWLTGRLQQPDTWWAITANPNHYPSQPGRSPKITHHSTNCSWVLHAVTIEG